MADLPFHTAAQRVLNTIAGDRKNSSRRPFQTENDGYAPVFPPRDPRSTDAARSRMRLALPYPPLVGNGLVAVGVKQGPGVRDQGSGIRGQETDPWILTPDP